MTFSPEILRELHRQFFEDQIKSGSAFAKELRWLNRVRETSLPAPAPILRWAGGKTRLLPEILARVPKTYGTYFEPFLGGGAVFFALCNPTLHGSVNLNGRPVVLGDANSDLVNLYRVVANDPHALARTLDRHAKRHGRRYYKAIRATFNERRRCKHVDRAAMFMYLNQTNFNGLWRVNKAGDYNVPIGRPGKVRLYDPAALVAASDVLLGAEIKDAGFITSTLSAKAGDFAYIDPPYDPLNASSQFTAYQADGFSRLDQVALADYAQALVRRGVQVMLSNSSTRFIRKLYKERGFKVERVMCPRMINSDATKRGAIAESLITGGYEP